ncbi:hypothetical protein HGA88_01195 [Candidatus Roizmanbacteria bacterium]|nr:hypothetical protein [Candidatus Roizmanbacteria bacterium]
MPLSSPDAPTVVLPNNPNILLQPGQQTINQGVNKAPSLLRQKIVDITSNILGNRTQRKQTREALKSIAGLIKPGEKESSVFSLMNQGKEGSDEHLEGNKTMAARLFDKSEQAFQKARQEVQKNPKDKGAIHRYSVATDMLIALKQLQVGNQEQVLVNLNKQVQPTTTPDSAPTVVLNPTPNSAPTVVLPPAPSPEIQAATTARDALQQDIITLSTERGAISNEPNIILDTIKQLGVPDAELQTNPLNALFNRMGYLAVEVENKGFSRAVKDYIGNTPNMKGKEQRATENVLRAFLGAESYAKERNGKMAGMATKGSMVVGLGVLFAIFMQIRKRQQ